MYPVADLSLALRAFTARRWIVSSVESSGPTPRRPSWASTNCPRSRTRERLSISSTPVRWRARTLEPSLEHRPWARSPSGRGRKVVCPSPQPSYMFTVPLLPNLFLHLSSSVISPFFCSPCALKGVPRRPPFSARDLCTCPSPPPVVSPFCCL